MGRTPLLESLVAEMRGNLEAYEDFVPLQGPERSRLVSLAPVRFRFCRKRPPTSADRDPSTLMTNRAKELAEAKFLRLVAQNIEPHPGPLLLSCSSCDLAAKAFPEPKDWKELADAKFARLLQEGIEPNPGPRRRRFAPDMCSVVSLNCGGCIGAWRWLNDAKGTPAEAPDVVFLQETSFKLSELRAFAGVAQKFGYVVTHVPPVKGPRGCLTGGVTTLVSTALRSRSSTHVGHEGGQADFVLVNGTMIVNLYVGHHLKADDFLRDVFDQVEAEGVFPCALVGDWNATSSENWLKQVLESSGFQLFQAPGTSSRWEGRRVIDYAFANVRLTDPAFLQTRWSDHKAFTFQLPLATVDRARLVELVPHPRYSPSDAQHVEGFCSLVAEQWRNCMDVEGITRAWEGIRALRGETLQSAVDDLWDELEGSLERLLWRAASVGKQQGISVPSLKRFFARTKGLPVRWRKRTHHANCSYRDNEANRLRVMRNLHARLRERERLSSACSSREWRSLDAKIRRCSEWQPGLTSEVLYQRILQEEARVKKCRLSAWKTRLREDREAFKWLKGRKAPVTHCVLDDEAEGAQDPSLGPDEAIQKITSFWRRIWDRCAEGETPAEEYLREYGPPRQEAVWGPVKATELAASARKQRNKASGLDGWASSEILSFPPDLWVLLECIFEIMEKGGRFPRKWALMRQCHIPKESESGQSLKASKLRPICVASLWFRIWGSARIRSQDARQWIESVLPPYVVGGRKGQDILAAVLSLEHRASEGAYLGTLDYTKAFDHLRPSRAAAVMEHAGMPKAIVEGLRLLWTDQRRVISWQGLCSEDVQPAGSSLPQGDAFSVLALSLTLRLPAMKLQQEHPGLTQLIYVDDRSWAASNPSECETVWNFWKRESTKLGFKENIAKAQFFHVTGSGRRRLRNTSCEAQVNHEFTVLGVTLRGKPGCKMSAKEKKRMEAAHVVAARSKALPLQLRSKAFLISCTSAAVASWGWLLSSPPKTHTRKLEAAWRALGVGLRQASVPLLKVLSSHASDLSFMSGVAVFAAFWRGIQKGGLSLQGWDVSLAVARLRAFMSDLGFSVLRPFVWTGRGDVSLEGNLQGRLQSAKHVIREAWRRRMLELHSSSSRRDAVLINYDEHCLKRARSLTSGSRHNLAIMSGAYVSHARFSQMSGVGITQCPYCDACTIPSKEHVWWHCQGVSRPPGLRPLTEAQRLLGWPAGGGHADHDRRVLAFLSEVRERDLKLRYDS